MSIFFNQETFNFNKRSILNNKVDGKWHQTHPVKEAHCDPLDHILHMTTDNVNSSQVLSISPPFVSVASFHCKETEFYIDVLEVPPQSSSQVLEYNCTSFQSDVDIFWNDDSLIAENVLHLAVDVAKTSNDLFWMYYIWIVRREDLRKTAEYMWPKHTEDMWTEDMNLGVISI